MHRLRLFAAVALTIATALPATTSAQTGQTGSVQGRIAGTDGRPLSRATIRLRQPDGSYPRAAQSDDRGEFRIHFIPPGTYTLEARLIGYRPLTVTDVVVRATEATILGLRLESAPTELATVTVTASSVELDKTTTEFSSSLTARERELLPTARNTNDLLAFIPGSRPGQVFGGSTNQANLYQLDGVMVNAPGTGGSFLLPNVDWLQDFTVVALGAGAEYGNFQGGLINMVTKQGTNTFQGAVRGYYENRSIGASNVNAFENGQEQSGRNELNVEARGPLIRDRLYYYVSGLEAFSSIRFVDFRRATTARTAWLDDQSTRHEQKYYGKLTYQASDRDIFNASLGFDNVQRGRVGLNGFDDPAASTKGQSPAVFYQGNWQRTVSPSASLEVKLSGYGGRDDQLSYAGDNQPSVRLLDVAGSPQYVNAFYTRRNSPSNHGVSMNYDQFLNIGNTTHQLKIGGDYAIGLWHERRQRNGGLSWYTYPRTGAAFNPLDVNTWGEIPSIGSGTYATVDTGGSIDLNADSRNAAAFIQDYIRINDRISLSAGLRMGYWAGHITPGNGGGVNGTAKFKAVSATGLDPRIGATFVVDSNQSILLKAHWGRYHQNMFALFYDRAPGSNVFTGIDFCNWNDQTGNSRPDPTRRYSSAEFSTLFTCATGTTLFNEANRFENYKQPYMDQITVGFERALGKRMKGELLYVNRVNKAVLALVDRNREQNWKPISNVQVFDGFGRVVDARGNPLTLPTIYVRADDLRRRLAFGTQFSNQIPGYTAADTLNLPTVVTPDLVITPVDEANRKFEQVQLAITGDFTRWSFNAAIAVTNLRGNVFSVNGYFNPDGQENGPFVEPNRAFNYDGNLENYSPIDFKLRATARLPWKIEGGMFVNVRTGDYWTPTLTVTREQTYRVEGSNGLLTLNRDLFVNSYNQQVFLEQRGSRQLETFGTLDLRAQRVIPVSRRELVVGLEVFNLLNLQSVSEVKTSVNNQDLDDPTSLAGAVRLRQQPLTIRLSSQLRW
jgi:hypothetical protein